MNIRFHSQVNIAETTQPAEVERIQVLRWLASQLPEGILRFGRTCTGGPIWRLVSRVLEITVFGKNGTSILSICGVFTRFRSFF